MKRLSVFLILILLSVSGSLSVQAKQPAKQEDSIEEQLKFKEGDEKGNDLKALKTEILVERSEKRALAQLQQLLVKHRGRKLEPDILYRLAELYMRRARTERFFEVHKNNQDIMNFLPALVKDASEKTEIRKAIAMYEDLQARFPNYHNLDAVVFNEAYAQQQLGDDGRAEKLFKKLTAEFKDSSLIPDAYMSIGEIQYSHKSFAQALESFKKVRDYPDARVYPYSIYKSAWCYYNLQNAKSGLKELELVVEYGARVVAEKLDAKLDLRKEALIDMTLFYTDVGDSNNAVDYFIAQSRELDAGPSIIRLSELYDRASKYKEVQAVLLKFIDRLPKSENVFLARDHLIWNYEHLKNRPSAVGQMQALNEQCQKPAHDKRNDCQERVTEDAKKLSQRWHALWKKKSTEPDLLPSAEVAYRIYLQNYDSADTEQNQLRMSFAELLFQENKFREASDQYATIDQYKPDEKLGHDAAYGAIVSLERATDNKWDDKDEGRFKELASVYLKKYPKGQFALDIEFKTYFIAYDKKRYDEAAVGFKKMGWGNVDKKKLGDEKIIKAQDLYLDILNIKGDYTNLKESAAALLKTNVTEQRLPTITKIYREAYFSEIQGFEEKGENKKAVEAYKKFAREQIQTDLAPKAWWNASRVQFKIGDVQGGAETCQEMYTLFPKNAQTRECLIQSASTYESLARLDLAANVLIDLAEIDTAGATKWRELAADFYALSGSQKKAIDMYLKFVDQRKDLSEKVALLEKVLELQKLDTDKKGYATTVQKIEAYGLEPDASRFVVEQAELLLSRGEQTSAFNLAKRVISKEGLPKNLLARARYVQAQVLDDEFKKQSVKARLEKVATVLAIKTEKLEKAQKAYQATIAYGDPETSVRASHRLAECYLHYSTALKNIQLSGEVSDADQQAFKKELDNLIVPMEEKGIESLNQSLQAARKVSTFDNTVVEIQQELNQLNLKKEVLPAGNVDLPPMYIPKRSMKFGGIENMGDG